MVKETVAVLGASGLTGSYLLPKLCDTYSRVVAISRRPLEHRRNNLDVVITDFGDDWEVDLVGVDCLFIAFGTTRKAAGSAERFRDIDLGIPLALARQAKAAGVKKIVLVSAVGASRSSLVHYTRVKGELEHAIRDLSFEMTAIIRPSLLLGEHRERMLETVAQKVFSPFSRFILPTFRPIEAEELAQVMIGAANLPDGCHVLEGKSLWALLRG